MRLFILALIIPLLGFAYVDYEPSESKQDIMWMHGKYEYSFSFPSYYRNLNTITLHFAGNCSRYSIFLIKNDEPIYYVPALTDGKNILEIKDNNSRGAEYRILIRSSRLTDSCGIVVGWTKNRFFREGIKRSDCDEFCVTATPMIRIEYDLEGLDKLRDDITFFRWGPHFLNSFSLAGIPKEVFVFWISIIAFFFVCLHYYDLSRVSEVFFYAFLSSHVFELIISYFLPLRESGIGMAVVLSGLVFVYANHSKILGFVRK